MTLGQTVGFNLFAGELFRRTRRKHTFSSNDLYDQKWETLFQHYNQIGAFFRFLEINKYAIQTGDHERSTQKQAKGRLVKCFKWTVKAWNKWNR